MKFFRSYWKSGLILLMMFIIMQNAKAQLKVGGNPYSYRKDASLELTGEKWGLLLNRVAKASLTQTPLDTAADGMIVYVKEDKQIYLKKGTWMPLADVASISGWSTSGNTGTDSLLNFIGTLDKKPVVFKVNNTEAARIASNGFVGVGTSDPTSALQVKGAIATSVVTATGNYTAVDSASVIIMNNAANATLTLQAPGPRRGRSIDVVAYGDGAVTFAGGTVRTASGTTQTLLEKGYTVKLVSNGTEWIVVAKQRPSLAAYLANGNNTDSEVARDLNAWAQRGTGIYYTDVQAAITNNIPGEDAWYQMSIVAKSPNNGYLGQINITDHDAFYRGGSMDTFANMSWRKLIAVPVAASFALQTEGNYDVNFNLSQQRNFYFSTNNAKRMTILGNGNVGIGTITPGVLFDVNGAARFSSATITGSASVGGALSVGGSLTASGATINGTMNATTVVANGATINGNLSATGSVAAASASITNTLTAATVNATNITATNTVTGATVNATNSTISNTLTAANIIGNTSVKVGSTGSPMERIKNYSASVSTTAANIVPTAGNGTLALTILTDATISDNAIAIVNATNLPANVIHAWTRVETGGKVVVGLMYNGTNTNNTNRVFTATYNIAVISF
ncbi:hypothetical protein LX64_04598 [Chitinophaga skermanii]|uniref:Uncharacterized protein n=1 Tax=Chitinophaga skermanii TaxID=331697 RepID=A0A327Q659_9BACT|nr:hypothetical protein [Chitinophaga skermanii]RAI99464.1 hypothetical protein LX64_04598 [Chitinophaga skermanii]